MNHLKKFPIFLLCILLNLAMFDGEAAASDTGSMTINRFVVCSDVDHHEPIGISDTFDVSTERVYAFLEAREISTDLEINFVWFRGEEQMAMIPLPIKKGPRWRTYSSKKIAGRSGAWRVEIRDGAENLLASQHFTIIPN